MIKQPIVWIALLCWLAACKPLIDLRLKADQIKVGQSFVYRQTVETETEIKAPKEEIPRVKSRAQSDFLCRLEQQGPEGSHWSMRLIRQTWERYMDDIMVQHYRSEDRESQLQYVLEYLLISDSMQFDFYLDKRGKVQRVEGFEKFLAKIDAKLPSPQEKEAFQRIMSDLEPASFSEMVRDVWAFYPSQPMRRNKRWQNQKTVALLNAQVTDAYGIALDRETAYDLDIVTTVKTDPTAPGLLKLGSLKIFYEMNGGGTGHARVSKTTGMLEQYYHHQLLIGVMSLKSPFFESENVPASIKTTTWIELLNL